MKQGIVATREERRAREQDEGAWTPPAALAALKNEYGTQLSGALHSELLVAHNGFGETYNPLRTLAQRIAHERLREWNPVSLHSPRKR